TTDLDIINKGNEPTFVTSRRREVIDLTLGSTNLCEEVVGWRVLEEESASDRRYISFEIGRWKVDTVKYRNPKLTNWSSYVDKLSEQLTQPRPEGLQSREDIDKWVGVLKEAINTAYTFACAEKIFRGKPTHWWTYKLGKLRKAVRNLAKRT